MRCGRSDADRPTRCEFELSAVTAFAFPVPSYSCRRRSLSQSDYLPFWNFGIKRTAAPPRESLLSIRESQGRRLATQRI